MTEESDSLLTILGDDQVSLSDLMGAVSELGAKATCSNIQSIGIASNITLNLMDVYLKRHAFLNDVDLKVYFGSYDDYLGDVETFVSEGVEQLFLAPFFDNLMPSFETQIQHLSEEVIQAKQDETTARLSVALQAGKTFKNIYLAKFHRYSTPSHHAEEDKTGAVIRRFNEDLEGLVANLSNVTLVDVGASITKIGHHNAFDERFYTSAKAPYKTSALNEIAKDFAVLTRGFGTRYYKAVILDCDDTLWGGVVGEDLIEGIKLDPYEYPGNVFWRIQGELLALEKSGALICLCSRNNPEDVQEVLEKHPHMLLKDEHLIIKKVNWQDKVSNLKEIADELSLGLDSFVFIDDSDFECQMVRDQLPMVKTIQVPGLLSDYFRVIEDVRSLFGAHGPSQEDSSKTEQYRMRNAGIDEASKFESQEDYLKSLGLEVCISRDQVASIPRISELTLKSNQFNLTTKRYSRGDIQELMQSEASRVYSFMLKDKFGSCGLTGVLIVNYEAGTMIIDTFLMSCRVVGRGVEFAVWRQVFEDAIKTGCKQVEAAYVPTAKNVQVKDFYERLGLDLVIEDDNGTKHYKKELSEMDHIERDYVKVIYA